MCCSVLIESLHLHCNTLLEVLTWTTCVRKFGHMTNPARDYENSVGISLDVDRLNDYVHSSVFYD